VYGLPVDDWLLLLQDPANEHDAPTRVHTTSLERSAIADPPRMGQLSLDRVRERQVLEDKREFGAPRWK
jgi:hypothetical protein